MAGAKNKKKAKDLARFKRNRAKDLEIKALMTGNPFARELARLYKEDTSK